MSPLRKPAPEPSSPLLDYERIDDLLIEFCAGTMAGGCAVKVEETVRQWLGRVSFDTDKDAALADALPLAMDLTAFLPSFSGSTAAERYARQRKPVDRTEAIALEGFKRARFRLLIIDSRQSADFVRVNDAATSESLVLFDRHVLSATVGWRVAARVCALSGGAAMTIGHLTPLDEDAFEVAMGFVRPGKGLINPERCAAAVYRHVVRRGAPRIPGLNLFPVADRAADAPEPEGMDALARLWADLAPGAEPEPEEISEVRAETSIPTIIQALFRTVVARRDKKFQLADAFMRIASIQLDTLYLRGLAGVGGERTPLDSLAAAIDRAIADSLAPTDVRTLFENLRVRLLAQHGAGAKAKIGAGDLDRVLQRIRALRDKTIDQGCSEQEALAAAAKVAELLDRYGLSLSEVEIKEQACESVGIDTDRRRRGAFDECIPSIGDFCDCKVWGEAASGRPIRYIFFGLPADVEAAHYLYDLIEATFETETANFKGGEIYAGMASKERRSAVNSFQIGFGSGLRMKLALLKTQRREATQASSGRDLVPLKASIIDDELEKLGLSFRSRTSVRKKTVMAEAYEAGQAAGHRFEIRAGLPAAG